VIYQHPWIFSGAIHALPKNLSHGSLVYVANDRNQIIATGTYSAYSMIAIRVLDFKETVIDTPWFEKRFSEAQERRLLMGYGPDTNTTG
jgi:23S rRNA (cytosine1962-C5)-methyltransferase